MMKANMSAEVALMRGLEFKEFRKKRL